MDLKTYIQTKTGNAKRLAESLGIPLSYVSQMASGYSAISPARAVLIEKVTDGSVTRQELRPDDWQAIWPELPKKRKAV